MSTLDAKIDDLYREPLHAFTSARNALAKTLSRAEAKRVRALAKPTLVPWAVNQVYWRARDAYDRLMNSGARLRKAQIAALEGRSADIRAASEEHRQAIGDAVIQAERLAASAGSAPGSDALARTFEALSLATEPPEAPGQLTQALQPAGFEALSGITPKEVGSQNIEVRRQKAEGRSQESEGGAQKPERRSEHEARRTKHDERQKKDEERRAAAEGAAARERQAALEKAEAHLARAAATEQQARAAWELAHDTLLEARRALSNLKSNLKSAI